MDTVSHILGRHTVRMDHEVRRCCEVEQRLNWESVGLAGLLVGWSQVDHLSSGARCISDSFLFHCC